MIVLITGCRSGFGLLTAVSLARAGHTVYAGLRDLSTQDTLVEASQGLDVHPVQLDVTDAADRDTVVKAILDKHGRIDALINNAGVALGGYYEELQEHEVRKVFEVNVFAVWALTQAVLPSMRQHGFGYVVQVSSAGGRMALPGLSAYAGSKFALEGMTESLAHEVAPFGIRVVLIEPGPYRTDMTAGKNRTLSVSAKSTEGPYAPYRAAAEALFDKVAARMGDPQDVADHIEAVLDQSSPRLRHPLGASAKLRLVFRWLFPFSWWAFVVARLTRP